MEKVVKISSLNSTRTDFEFWMTKSYQERLDALESLREQHMNFKNVQPGLQKVCKLIKSA